MFVCSRKQNITSFQEMNACILKFKYYAFSDYYTLKKCKIFFNKCNYIYIKQTIQ